MSSINICLHTDKVDISGVYVVKYHTYKCLLYGQDCEEDKNDSKTVY